jgi:hypothetical protein
MYTYQRQIGLQGPTLASQIPPFLEGFELQEQVFIFRKIWNQKVKWSYSSSEALTFVKDQTASSMDF